MVKKVRFSEKVDVRYMDVNLKEHSREVKNPIGYKQSLAKNTKYIEGDKNMNFSSPGSLSFISCLPSWGWWVLSIILVIIIIYFIRKYYFLDKNNSKKSPEEPS